MTGLSGSTGGGGGGRGAGAASGAATGAALGTAVNPGIGTAVGAIAGGLAGAFLGGGSGSGALRPGSIPNIIGGGLKLQTTAEGDRGLEFRVKSFPFRRELVSNIAGIFGRRAQEFGRLRDALGPGFQNVLNERLNAIRNARSRAIGSISENLSQRRVLGSSFGQAAIAQAEREFGEAEATARAQTFLERIDVESQLITQETGAAIDAFNTELGELDTQLGLAAGSLGPLTSAATSLANTNAQLAAAAASGRGQFFAQAGGALGGVIQNVIQPSPSGGVITTRPAGDIFRETAGSRAGR